MAKRDKAEDTSIEKIISKVKKSFVRSGFELDDFDTTVMRKYLKKEITEYQALSMVYDRLVEDDILPRQVADDALRWQRLRRHIRLSDTDFAE